VQVRDDDVANKLEGLMGTLRSAKKKKIITYEGEMLWQVCHLCDESARARTCVQRYTFTTEPPTLAR
jgi:hypothetical protein